MNTLYKKIKLALKNPELAAYKAQITFRNQVTAKWDYHLMNGTARPPACICIKLTNACNLRCAMCGQPREGSAEGSPKWAAKEFFKQRLDISTLKRLIDQVAAFRPNIYLWGGEPFLYRDIIELIRYIKQNKLTAQINTNALLLKKNAADLVQAGLDDLIISIDGPAEVHDAVRGLKGTFALVEQGIRAVQEEKRRQGLKKPIIRIRGTICPENFQHLSHLVAIATDFGADSLGFNWTWFTTEKTGQAHYRLMKQLFGIEAVSWQPYQTDVIMNEDKRRQTDGIRQELRKLRANNVGLPITISPRVPEDQVDRYYTDITETFGSDHCYAVWIKSYILPNGDVTPCPDYPDYITGNINRNDFLEIWNGEKYRNWRLELKKSKLFPVCYRCCDLFLSNVEFL